MRYARAEEKHTYEGNTRHQQGSNERPENTLLSSVVQTVPPEHVEVTRSVHVARVDLAGVRVDEIVLHERLVPRADEFHRYIIGDLQVTVHSEETLECAVDGVMEGDGVETVIRRVA